MCVLRVCVPGTRTILTQLSVCTCTLYYYTPLLVAGLFLCAIGRGHVHGTCFGRRRCLVVDVIRFDLSSQMPGRTGKQSNVHTAQHVIDGVHQHGVPGKEEARQGQRRVLRD